MNEYDLMNLYFNFIFNEGKKSFRDVYASYEQLGEFKNWLTEQEINFPFVNQIQKNECELLFRSKNFETYDTAFKTNYENEYHRYIIEEKQKYQIILLSGLEDHFFDDFDKKYNHEIMRVFCIKKSLKEDVSLYGPYHLFLNALFQIDHWPGIFIFKGEQSVFYPLKGILEINHYFKLIEENQIFEQRISSKEEQYFVQLSDLHLGTKKTDNGLIVLQESFDELYHMLPHNHQLKFLITGDLMNSPNRKNMYAASRFMNRLKRKYHSDVTFVLGNHDVIVYGLNLLKKQKTKVVAYLLGENIKVYPDVKMIVIKIDSTSQGNLARGMVGQRLLKEIEDELLSIDHLEDYTLIAMMHHHLMPLRKDDFLKIKWNEKLFMGKIADSTKALVDAQDVMYWLEKHHVRYIFHGHKHIPCVVKKGNTYIMAGGSSCGGGTRERKSSYLSYNLLKYNRKDQAFKYCFVFYDDLTKQERHRVKIKLFMEDQNEVSR